MFPVHVVLGLPMIHCGRTLGKNRDPEIVKLKWPLLSELRYHDTFWTPMSLDFDNTHALQYFTKKVYIF